MQNNSKQIVLSLIGIVLLIIAVVGVSFAFFTYSKTGSKNNVITTGNITFSFNDAENNVVITNQFPKTAAEALDGSQKSFDFSVTGNIPTGNGPMNYEVYALAGSVPEAIEGVTKVPTDKFQDSDIKLYLKASDTTTGLEVQEPSDTITIAGNYGTEATGDTAGNSTAGFKLASSSIPADGKDHTHSYKLTMWVSDSVTISDTDARSTYRASEKNETNDNVPATCSEGESKEANGCLESGQTDDRKVYSDLYYSLKIKVVAGDAITS